jgi:hypothetical protein
VDTNTRCGGRLGKENLIQQFAALAYSHSTELGQFGKLSLGRSTVTETANRIAVIRFELTASKRASIPPITSSATASGTSSNSTAAVLNLRHQPSDNFAFSYSLLSDELVSLLQWSRLFSNSCTIHSS